MSCSDPAGLSSNLLSGAYHQPCVTSQNIGQPLPCLYELYYGAITKSWTWGYQNDEWGWCYLMLSPYFCHFCGWLPQTSSGHWGQMGECPECECPRDKLGDEDEYKYRDLGDILGALAVFGDPDTQVFVCACREAGIKPITHPFWEDLPYTNIYHSIAPDILHQLHQGVIKHLLSWLKRAFGKAEIDAQSWQFPPNHNICLLWKV